MGFLTQEDSTLYRGWFKEMAKLRGFSVGYQYPLDTDKTIHSEPNIRLSNPIRMDIIFNENPRVGTLRKLGWVTEINEQKPVIAQLPFDAPHLARYARIIIPPFVEINSRSRVFQVTKMNTLLEFPDCWTVALVPVFDSYKEDNEYAETNINYMDTKSEGSRSPITDDISVNGGDDNYTFMNGD